LQRIGRQIGGSKASMTGRPFFEWDVTKLVGEPIRSPD
jgi:hypothetical protein